MKIVVSAYACEPDKGSEPEVGWQWVMQLARKHDVWVFTRANNRQSIENSGYNIVYPSLTFVYMDLPSWASFWKKGNRGVHLYYALWQLLVVFYAWRLHRKVHFDLAQHLTFSPFYSIPLISILPIPFIWGPIGAGEILPRQYWSLFTPKQRAREVLRLFIRKLAVFNPIIYMAMRKAALIIAATEETRQVIPQRFQNKVVVEPQIGMNVEVSLDLDNDVIRNDSTFRVLTAGRHVYWKGHLLIIRAFAKFIKKYPGKSELIILSNGPEYQRLQFEAQRLGIESKVIFKKWLPTRKDVFKEYIGADIFAYSSFFECGGYVVLEAMACGLPVVSIDLGGPGEIVTNDCGVLITSDSIDETIDGFSKAFTELSNNRELLYSKRVKTLDCVVKKYQWSTKGERFLQLIEELRL